MIGGMHESPELYAEAVVVSTGVLLILTQALNTRIVT
jgi:hypothetical protein